MGFKDRLIEVLGGVTLEEHNRVRKFKDDELAALQKQKGTLIDESQIFFDVELSGGRVEHCCDDESALAILLADGTCFLSAQDYDSPWEPKEKSTAVVVNCNDLFWWATGDAEPLPNAEIGNLYRMHKASKWGSSKWCCLRRKLRPQVPIVEDMKKDGFWDAELEALPAPEPS